MTTAVRTTSIPARLGVAVVVAALVNLLLATVAGALDDGGIGMGLQPAVFLPATVVGVLLGTAGWFAVRRVAPRALPVVIPVVVALTWIPDLLLFGQGATVANVVGLMAMHAVVASAVVVALRPTVQ
ncbi:DUF6069 family protein [Actinomycetospora sp. NBRC 106378]|uniref:DUF6069 family protein n=1 Tax=Actinomycetospora sp. NBRC 106378 TaxID=3032208 RepID=UPI0024A2358A|nr:DUF6069 family protein [Actinomycetospora sp. NBRC 106378]GLZ51988.1 hypothetical protein Acsp07_16050 [Actinomycetospora sp. NBRC 106378]